MQHFPFSLAVIVLFSVPAAVVNAQEDYFGRSESEATPTPAVLATPSPTAPLPAPTAAAPAVPLPVGGVKIVTALWGTGHVYADVTAVLNEALRQPGGEIGVGPTELKCDPALGTRKDLITVFEWNGLRYVMGLPEDSRISATVFRDFVRAHSLAPPTGPELVAKTKPRSVEQLRSFLAETTWEMGPENGTPNWGITFYPNGVFKVRGGSTTGAWSVENASTIRLWNKDLATFNADYTRFRAMGDDTAYLGLLKQ